MLRLRSLLNVGFVLLATAVTTAGCASSEESPATADFDGGPTTTRPDDGVDSRTDATGADGGADSAADATSGDTAASTDATGDAASTDTKTDVATSDAQADAASTEAATDAAASDGAGDTAAASGPKIHEVACNDILSTGARAAFVEITAPPGTPLTTLHIRAIKENGTVAGDWVLSEEANKVMPASGVWVVAGQTLLASEGDQFYGITSPDNWDIPCSGAIQLNDHSGLTVQNVDVVGYGAVAANPAAAPTVVGEGGLAPTPTSAKSIGRRSVPGDTNVNAADFCTMSKSPKATNHTCS